MNKALKTIICIFSLLSVQVSFGQQTVEALEQEILKAQREIEKSQKLLSQTRDKQKSSITRLKLTQSNINNRKSIISNLDKQLRIVSNDINGNNLTISKLSKELANLKKDYAKSIVNRYKDIKQSNYLVFLFSSSNFYDIQTRSEYLERIAGLAKVKSDDIAKISSEIGDKNKILEKKNSDITRLRVSRASELNALTKEEKEYKELLVSLGKEEVNLNANIRKQAQQISLLQNKIEKLIEEVAYEKAELSAVDKEELAALSLKFAENKGKLPPPVQGVITSRFGINNDPIQKNVKVKNNGVNITATENYIKSIFAGEVVKVFFFQGLNNSVMIRHGSYLSVYSNMSEVFVEVGDMVRTEERIGRLTGGENQTVHFELWEETTPVNPVNWIKF